jgi:hypothetical protein
MAIRRTQKRDSDAEDGTVRNQTFGQIRGEGDGVVRRSFRDQAAGSDVLRTGTEFQARGSAGGRTAAQRRPPARREAPPDPSRVQEAARHLVTAPDRGENRDTAGDQQALLAPGAGIGGLSENAVAQKGANFDSVSDPLSGFSVPNQADPTTKAAFNRFFKKGGSTQESRDADPTRVAFQNRFFPSETLSDAGTGGKLPRRVHGSF